MWVVFDCRTDEMLRGSCRCTTTNMILLTISSEASTLSDVERISDIRFSEWGFTDGAQNGIFGNSVNDTSNLIGKTPNSTLADMPSSTPLESSPSSTPPRSDPPSTPVGDKPTPTPTGGYSGDLPRPSSS